MTTSIRKKISANSQPGSILIINDSISESERINSILKSRNYQILIALDKKMIDEAISQNTYDLIILDMELSDMKADDILEELKKNPNTSDVHILVMSSLDDANSLSRLIKIGANEFFLKPFIEEQLLLKVDSLIDVRNKVKQINYERKILQEYKDTVDQSSIVSKTDKNGIITFANDKFCDISGYRRDELIGKSHNIIRHPDMRREVFKELWTTIKKGNIWEGIVKNRKKDGSHYWVKTVINPIIDNYGNIIEFIGIRTDITELEEYKQLLQQKFYITDKNFKENFHYAKQYENSINSMMAILKTDTENNIIHANEKFCSLSGYDLEELVGRKCTEFRATHHRARGDCENIAKELKKGKRVNRVLENISKNGDSFIAETLFCPITDVDGKQTQFLEVMHDITQVVKLNQEIIDTQKEIINTMGSIGEMRSKEAGLHVVRVAEFSYILAKLFGMSDDEAELLRLASPMHDIGKVGIEDSILNKPGMLSDEEFEIVKTHTELGYEMLKHSKRDILKASATVAYTHHERWDGKGYPKGLSGEDIPIFGRITAIADVFDALSHDRVYKKAWDDEKIFALFKKEKGKQFDPILLDLFLENIEMFLEARARLEDKG
ncbi:MAG: PAS domain S-box protein [Sulfurospirillaceae bacterium]|nr:PAS domain S-box protein [Sulfurospirillaceae bacterium]